ncbi:MAG TPA: universal stress protein [Verrucomicrobiae bacterium]|nr:universal stress protein [Verrucomicrobiae bacterium]
MKALVYANRPDRARQVASWVSALAGKIPGEAVIQVMAGAPAVELEAARILAAELAPATGAPPRQATSPGGSPEEVIAAQAAEGDYGLVVLAPAGRRGFIRLFYGSMVAHVVRRVSTSVLIVRSVGQAPPRKILVCVSGSRHSLTSVTVAAQLAGLFGAELTLLTVLSQVSVDLAGREPFGGDPDTLLETNHPLAGHLRVAGELAERMGARATVRVRQGLIAEEIVEEATRSGADLLVVGTHRAEDFDTVYDDITDQIVQSSPVSTLVVGLRAALL